MFAPTLSNRQAITSFLAWWLFWMLIQSIILHRLGWSWEIAVIDSVLSNSLLALAGFITQNTYRFYRPGADNRLQRMAYSIALTLAQMFCLKYVLSLYFEANLNYLEFIENSMPIRYTFSFLMIAFLTVVNWLWFFMKEQDEIKKRKVEADQLSKEAELRALRQQLQPHFLFNSLNSISALAGTKPEEARKMIQQLSDFLRTTLRKDEQQMVLLSEEMKHLALYLEIEMVRFGHRLVTQLSSTDESLNLKLPSLLLQPLVENAIKFGLYDTIDAVTIEIKTEKVDSFLKIEIKNPYDAQTANPSKGTGFGLSSVQRRLYLMFARQDLLKTEQTSTHFISTLLIPQFND